MELKDYLRVLRRRWYVVLLVWAAVGAIHTSLVKQEAQMYEATSEIVLKEPQFYYIAGGDAGMPLPWLTISSETRYSLMKSEPVLTKTAGYLWSKHPQFSKLVHDAFTFDEANARATGRFVGEMKVEGKRVPYLRDLVAEAIEYLRGALRVDRQKETQIVLISARDADAEKAKQLADSLAYAFREYMDEDSKEQSQKAIDLLEDEITDRSKQIDEKEKEVAKRRAQLEQETRSPAGQNLVLLQKQSRVADLGQEIAKADFDIAELTQELKDPPESLLVNIPEGDDVKAVRAQIATLKTQVAQWRVGHEDGFPPLQKALRQLGDLTGSLEKLVLEDKVLRKNRLVMSLGDSIREKSLFRDQRDKERTQLQKEIQEILGKEEPGGPVAVARQGLSLLEGKLQLLETQRSGFLARQSSIALSQEMKGPLVDILAEAKAGHQLPKGTQTSWPFVLLIGALVGVGSAYFLEYMSSTIRTESDIKRYVNLQMLGAVLRIKEADQRLLLTVAPKQPLHEVYNMIGALMDSYAVEHKAKVFMIASSRAEEGKSTVTTNLGIALAKGGERVILLDCDLRKAVLHRFLNVDNSRGLTTALLGDRETGEGARPVSIDELLRPTEVEGLRVLPAGPHPQNPVGLLKSEGFRRILREAREQADVVLVDVPPVNLAVDPLVLAPLMDGIILLVSAGDVTKDEVTHAKRLIEGARGKLIGCILNKVTLEGRGYYYYYYHYYYDAYKAYRES